MSELRCIGISAMLGSLAIVCLVPLQYCMYYYSVTLSHAVRTMLDSYPGSNYAGEEKRAWYLPFAVA